jgi:hypothetical protein
MARTLDPDPKAVPTPEAGHDIKTLGPSDSSACGSDMARPGLIDDDALNLDRGTNEDVREAGHEGADR